MTPLVRKIAQTPLLWLLVFVPAVPVVEVVNSGAHTLLFLLRPSSQAPSRPRGRTGWT